jgi:hypothetical protein
VARNSALESRFLNSGGWRVGWSDFDQASTPWAQEDLSTNHLHHDAVKLMWSRDILAIDRARTVQGMLQWGSRYGHIPTVGEELKRGLRLAKLAK